METYFGKEVIRTKAPYKIERETSKYNKYMKWHLTMYYADNDAVLSSQWFKTEREAKESIERMKNREPSPIGNHYHILEPQEKEATK